MFVSEYNVTRHYGGPEEGGWYYDVWTFSNFMHREFTAGEYKIAKMIAKDLNEKAKGERRQPDGGRYQGRFSVAGHTDQLYVVEKKMGEYDTSRDPRPRYE